MRSWYLLLVLCLQSSQPYRQDADMWAFLQSLSFSFSFHNYYMSKRHFTRYTCLVSSWTPSTCRPALITCGTGSTCSLKHSSKILVCIYMEFCKMEYYSAGTVKKTRRGWRSDSVEAAEQGEDLWTIKVNAAVMEGHSSLETTICSPTQLTS